MSVAVTRDRDRQRETHWLGGKTWNWKIELIRLSSLVFIPLLLLLLLLFAKYRAHTSKLISQQFHWHSCAACVCFTSIFNVFSISFDLFLFVIIKASFRFNMNAHTGYRKLTLTHPDAGLLSLFVSFVFMFCHASRCIFPFYDAFLRCLATAIIQF